MTKKEVIWREILFQAIDKKKTEFTQKELARKYGFSLSTVFNALKPLRLSGAAEIHGRGFRIIDTEKLLYLWATFRKLNQDIVYQTHTTKNVRQIEGEMPPSVIFGAFSAFIKKHQEAPADYDKVCVYSNKKNLEELKKRFPPQNGPSNLVVIKADPWLADFGKTTPNCQTFVDLWNCSEWYAKDFLNALKEKMF